MMLRPFSLCIVVAVVLVNTVWASGKPNILLIYSDDHGWADLGSQGVDSDIKTPNLDRLARDGVRFTRGYVSAPQCVPSRAGVMTGRYQQRFGVEDNSKGPLPVEEQTIAERLKVAGYVTGMVGKWHLDSGEKKKAKGEPKGVRMLVDHMPGKQGFDEYWRGETRQFYASHDLRGKAFLDAPHLVADDRFRVVVQTEAALGFLDRRSKQPDTPWFMYLAWFAPHVPLDSPEPWYSQTPSDLPRERRQALSMIAAMDDGLGRIREKLRSINQSNNTLIVFIGDNGAPVKPGAWDGSINAPLVGEKGMLTDGGVRVPFLAAWPDKFPAGQIFDHPVINLDIAATAVAMAGLPHEDTLDGVNLIPFVTGEKKTAPHDALFWRWRSQASILEYPWKLIWLGDHTQYLFDVSQPDGETDAKNLLAKHPDIAKRLGEKWRAWSNHLQPPGPVEANNDQDDYFFAKHVKKLPEEEAQQIKSPRRTERKSVDSQPTWVCRNGTLVEKPGLLEVVSESDSKTAPFLAVSSFNYVGPCIARISVKASSAGQASIAWRTSENKDFLPANRVPFAINTNDWETHELKLPASGRMIHLRFLFPGGTTLIREFTIQSSDGKNHSLVN